MKRYKIHIYGLIISFAVLIIPIAYVIYSRMKSYIISDVMILIPIIAFGVSVLIVLIKRVPNIIKLVFLMLILVFSLFSFCWLNIVGGHIEFRTLNGINEIDEYYTDFSFNEFGEYEDIVNYKYHSTGIFQQKAYTTILKYDKDNFEREKTNIETNYNFYDKPIAEGEPSPVFVYADFNFKVEIVRSPEQSYPKQLYLIGINDKSYEIAYVYFEDYDLDGVLYFSDILETYCGWRYIIKERQ